MSSLVLDPLQRVTRFKFDKGTVAVMAFCDESSATYEDEYGPYIWVDDDDNPSTNPWWFDDVAKWRSVYEEIGLKGVAFDVDNAVHNFPYIVPPGETVPEGVPVVDVEQPPSIDALTQEDFRPTVRSHYFASDVDPRFYIFVDNSGSMITWDIRPTLDEYLAQLREWRVPYRVIEINVYGGEDLRSGLGAEQWLQWLCAPFVGGFDLGHDDAIYEDWTP